jgi:hypothetical protein
VGFIQEKSEQVDAKTEKNAFNYNVIRYSIVKCSQLGGAKSLRNANKIENAFFCSFSFFIQYHK